MLSIGILAMSIISLMSFGFSVIRMNKLTEMRIAALNAINVQMNELLSAAAEKARSDVVADSPAKGLLLTLRDRQIYLDRFSEAPDEFPYRITFNQAAAILTYEFMVPLPGGRASGIADSTEEIMRRHSGRARGALTVYLREDAVPKQFLEWGNSKESGDLIAWDHDWFPMEPIQGAKGTGDFTGIFSGSSPDWDSYNLANLPIALTVRYYTTDEQAKADSLVPNGENRLDWGTAQIGASRFYIITPNSLGRL
jgi:hypothetical protein